MNPLSWDGPDTLRDLLPNHLNNHNCMENTSRINNDWGIYTESLRHTKDENQSSMGVHLGWETPSLPSHNCNKKDSEVEDPDGAPLEIGEEDPELSRKRKELQQIEEQIIFKKAALALKTVGLLVNKTMPSDSYNDHSATCDGQTLKDRVNEILKQRHSPSFLSKVREQINSSSKEGPLQENHPLKRRVNALMKKRRSHPVLPTNKEVPDITLPPASKRFTPANEENNINKGFQRFLSVLNKGVDIDLLSRIITDDSKDPPLGKELLNIQPSVLENKLDFSSSCRAKSPVKKRQKKEEELTKVDEQMNKLAHPTQERLYGKKHVDTRADSRGDQGSQQRSSQSHCSISSSSSASSWSTRSRGSSPSTPQHHRSNSRDSKQWFESSCTSVRGCDQLKGRDNIQDIVEAQNYRDRDDKVMPPLSRSNTSPASEENDINKGFQRFISLLNKGVDIDLLSRIVTDDSKNPPLSKELLNSQPSALENKSDPASMRKSQQSSREASLSGCSQANSVERKTDLPSEERSLNKRLSLPADAENSNDGGKHSFGSSSKSKSPVKKKKKKEEQPKVDEQQEHLQNILKTLGLTLETEEINKLAHRTQERLYGKKHEDIRANSRGDRGSQQRSSQKHCSISSSSSASSRSTRSRSSSRGTPEHGPSRTFLNGESRDELRGRDYTQHSITESYTNKDNKEIPTYQHPYPQNQTYPQSHSAAFSEYPNYSLSQDSGYYNADLNSYWSYGTTPPSVNPLGTFHQCPGPVEQPNMVYPQHNSCGDSNLMNPDLSTSEGQFGPCFSKPCLQVISTKQPTTDHCIKQHPCR